MQQALIVDLVQSLKEVKAIAKGDMPASRRFTVASQEGMLVREQTVLSQSKFAELMPVNVKRLQN